ncbi:unnamed protein product, partial [Rotaria socialis]
RYPFSPFIIRFSTRLIQEQKAAEELCKFVKDNKQIDLELCGFRKSTSECLSNEFALLLFVKTSYSFFALYDENNWPQSLLGLAFSQPYAPSIPPQLSLLVKNVSLTVDFAHFTNEV